MDEGGCVGSILKRGYIVMQNGFVRHVYANGGLTLQASCEEPFLELNGGIR